MVTDRPTMHAIVTSLVGLAFYGLPLYSRMFIMIHFTSYTLEASTQRYILYSLYTRCLLLPRINIDDCNHFFKCCINSYHTVGCYTYNQVHCFITDLLLNVNWLN